MSLIQVERQAANLMGQALLGAGSRVRALGGRTWSEGPWPGAPRWGAKWHARGSTGGATGATKGDEEAGDGAGSSAGNGEGKKAAPEAVGPELGAVLRSTQGFHKLLRAWYQGQERASALTRGGYAAAEINGPGPSPRAEADRELEMLRWYDSEMPRRRVRPTALQPVVEALGYAGGFLTRLPADLVPPLAGASRRATALVEGAFAEHVDDQLREIYAFGFPREEGSRGGAAEEVKRVLVKARDAERGCAAAEEVADADADADAEGEGGAWGAARKHVLNADSLFRASVKAVVDQTKRF